MSKIPDPDKMKRIQGPVLSKKELKSAKIRITTYLDENVLDVLRRKEGLVARISRLEKAVFSKTA